MLIDEVLSIGDIGFRNKSLRKIYDYKQQANGVIFISHDLEQVKNLCDRIIVLEGGRCGKWGIHWKSNVASKPLDKPKPAGTI